jgi:hypothetical protein
MRAALVRVGVDQAYGGWNSPIDPVTNEFVYVPIPDDGEFHPGLRTPYESLRPVLREFADTRECKKPAHVLLPDALGGRNMHLDPDFDYLTYGDKGRRRGKGIAQFGRDDVVVFYAGMRPCSPSPHRLIYAIIGPFRVAEVVRINTVKRSLWAENAHTRRIMRREDDIIVRAMPGGSGRLRRCIPIGEWREGAYRVRTDLLDAWGGLSCRNGFIQRSAVPPMFLDPERFLAWFEAQQPALVAMNNPAQSAFSAMDESTVTGERVIMVHLRQPGIDDARTDPLYEFGSFGLTGCHRMNLLADSAAAGCRLAFAQGGPLGFRLVMLTPPIDVRELGNCHEAFWSPANMPLRYDAAPLLIDNEGRSDVAGLAKEFERARRSSWMARFSSAFRSRKRPLRAEVGANLIAAWTRATQDPNRRARVYHEALPRQPDVIDNARHVTYRRLKSAALGEPEQTKRLPVRTRYC